MLVLLFAFPALAVEPSEVLSDPVLEARARTIGQALRCVVCQNQSIDDSAAEVAHDMRCAVRERLTAGDSNDQVFAFMVARYGDYVLLKPPFKTGTLVLWLGAPLLLLLAGGGESHTCEANEHNNEERQDCHPERSEGPFLWPQRSLGLRPRDDSDHCVATPCLVISTMCISPKA